MEIANRKFQIENVPVAILAGGLATRLGSITQQVPKALIKITGKPFIDHQLALLHRNGIRRAVLCVGHLGEQIEAHVGDGARFGMSVRYSHDGDKLMGTGGALRRARHLLDDVFWVMYSDSYMDIDYRAALADFARRDLAGLMVVLLNNNRWDRSNVVFRDGQLLRYDKRRQTPDMQYIDYGVAMLRRDVLDRIPDDRPYDLADLYSQLVADGQMAGHEVTNRFYEIGTPASLEEARRYLKK